MRKRDDIRNTDFYYGYITANGGFYHCNYCNHSKLCDSIAEEMGVWSQKMWNDSDGEIGLPQRVIEIMGWIKVDYKDFYWDTDIHTPNSAQKDAMNDYMMAREFSSAKFNDIHLTIREMYEHPLDGSTELPLDQKLRNA